MVTKRSLELGNEEQGEMSKHLSKLLEVETDGTIIIEKDACARPPLSILDKPTLTALIINVVQEGKAFQAKPTNPVSKKDKKDNITAFKNSLMTEDDGLDMLGAIPEPIGVELPETDIPPIHSNFSGPEEV